MPHTHSSQTRQPHRAGPKGYQRSDERLKEDISERLMEAYDIDCSDVSVHVQGGKVTLEGTVPDRYMKYAIEEVADRCAGVQDVDNRIRVSTADRTMAGELGTSGNVAASTTGTAGGSARTKS